tara:strand:+ start:5329 stop:5505 length:177 start_codon:yes stop_codon:yes gene_type:complete
MTDTELVQEVMHTLEQASYLAEKVVNDEARAYIESVLHDAYTALQMQIVSKMDSLPYV